MGRLFLLTLAGWLLLAGQAHGLTSQEIDDALARAQTAAHVQPAPRAADSVFLRRLSLDVRGVVPTLEETIAFLQDDRPDKRQRLIEAFLQSAERGSHWGAYWDKLLVGTLTEPANRRVQQQLKTGFRHWVAAQFNDNVPYHDFVSEIIVAQGTTTEVPQTLALARWRRSPESMAGSISRVFLGADIQCAQCHDHKDNPELTQEKFWQFASFFANTRAVPQREMGRVLPIVEVSDVGIVWRFEVPDTETRMVVQPTYLDGSQPERRIVDGEGKELSLRSMMQEGRRFRQTEGARAMADMGGQPESLTPQQLRAIVRDVPRVRDTRRDELAVMMTHGDQEQLARSFMNRLWARFFGRGLMEPLDGWVTPSTPDHPELLEALTHEFIDSGFDVRHMERLILGTRAYGRSSVATESSAQRPELFAHAAVRPLAPDQLIDSLARVTHSSALSGEGSQRADQLRTRFEQQFLFAFDSDEMEWVTSFEPSITRALFFLNDPTINEAVTASGSNFLAAVAARTSDPEEVLDYLFLSVLARPPSEQERTQLIPMLVESSGDRLEYARLQEDLLWALVTSTEFITNH